MIVVLRGLTRGHVPAYYSSTIKGQERAVHLHEVTLYAVPRSAKTAGAIAPTIIIRPNKMYTRTVEDYSSAEVAPHVGKKLQHHS